MEEILLVGYSAFEFSHNNSLHSTIAFWGGAKCLTSPLSRPSDMRPLIKGQYSPSHEVYIAASHWSIVKFLHNLTIKNFANTLLTAVCNMSNE